MKKIIIGIVLVFLLQGCQSKYQQLIVAIDKQNTENIKKTLEESSEEITMREASTLYHHAISSYGDDKKGLEVLKLLESVSPFPNEEYLSTLCQHDKILERVKYLINRGNNLYQAWSVCKNNKEAYDYYHIEMKKIKELNDAKKENEIAIQKRAKRVKGSPFSSSLHLVVTDIEKGNKSGDITACSARVDRINTGTFEFNGLISISDERATLHINKNTKFLIRENYKYLEEDRAKEVFYKNISKPSSYYLSVIDKNRNILQIERFESHIFHSAEELHKSIGY
jgi:uncharacterized protein YxeA